MIGSTNDDRRTSHDYENKRSNTQAQKRQAKEKEENGKERANKTARVKWGRGKREANGK